MVPGWSAAAATRRNCKMQFLHEMPRKGGERDTQRETETETETERKRERRERALREEKRERERAFVKKGKGSPY